MPFNKLIGHKRLLSAVLMAAIAAAVMLASCFRDQVDSITITQGAYNYFGEERVEFKGPFKLSWEDGTAYLKNSDGKQALDSKPLYGYDGTVTFPADYVWNNIDTGIPYRLAHFSQAVTMNNSVTITDEDREAKDAPGFLFDGNNTYVFLESVQVSVGGETFRVSPLSCLVARYGNTLSVFHYGDGSSRVIRIEDEDSPDMKAQFENGDTLDMGTDMVTRANGSMYLLVVRPEALDRM